MSDENDVQELLDYGLTPEERQRLGEWEDGFGTDFWSLFTKNLATKRREWEVFCTGAANEAEWRLAQGRIQEIDRILNLRDTIRLTYANVAQERKNELEQLTSLEDLPDDPDFA